MRKLLFAEQSGSAVASHLVPLAIVALGAIVGLAPLSSSLTASIGDTSGSAPAVDARNAHTAALTGRSIAARNPGLDQTVFVGGDAVRCNSAWTECETDTPKSSQGRKGRVALGIGVSVVAGTVASLTALFAPFGFLGVSLAALAAFAMWGSAIKFTAQMFEPDLTGTPAVEQNASRPSAMHGITPTLLGGFAGAASAHLIQFGPWGIVAAATLSGVGLWLSAQTPRSFRDSAVSYGLGMLAGGLLARGGLLPSKSALAAGGEAQVLFEATAGLAFTQFALASSLVDSSGGPTRATK